MAAPASTATTNPSTSFRPAGTLDLANALVPYSGPWGAKQAAHLLRRAAFGGSPDDVARLASSSVNAAVDGLVHFANASNLPNQPPIQNDYRRSPAANAGMFGSLLRPASDEAIKEARKAIAMTRRGNAIAMEQWFLDRMIQTPAPLQEKMTLFLTGHFTSSYQKGIPAEAIVNQNNLFRANALGNLRQLTLAVSRDPAMLRYLDNAENVKSHPNENYARELMELFTLGIGNYTETDVRESARAFTGWSINRRDYTFVDNAAQHDDGNKTFLGKTGNFAGNNIVDIIFEQPAASRWFATKLLNFFVYNDPEPPLIDAVATLIRKNDFNLLPVMSTLLRSNVFFSDRTYRALVKSPVDFVVGSYKLYGIKQSDVAALAALRRMSQVLFYPPNVKGWDGGAQWLNSQTVLTRENFASSLQAQMMNAPWIAPVMQKMNAAAIAGALTQTILQGDVSSTATTKLIAYLDGTDTTSMSKLSGENADERVRGAAYLTMAMPAYQLA